jgi:sigma-B regulation protein RsbU (phosphoserine phosphatase)
LAQLKNLASDAPTEVDGYLVIRHAFVSAPWNLYYVVPNQAIWLKLLWERGAAMLSMFLGLTALMVVTYLVTTRDFVSPASKLVQHLAAESQFKAPPLPIVPAAWVPWFQSISKAFRESLQLLSIRQELDIAAKMQQSILPRHWPEQGSFSLWGAMRSAKEVGGDFYDHFELSGHRTGIVIADVSGKGVPAALFGMVSKTLLRSTATQAGRDASSVVEMVNDALCLDNDSCMFVTVLFATLDKSTGQLFYVNAGHPPPLLIHADGQTEFLPMTGGMALGVAEAMPFDHHQIQLAAGDRVVFYTDGVTEAMNMNNDEFTQERLPPLLGYSSSDNVKATVQKIIDAVDDFAQGAPQSDDITCLALHFHGEDLST